MESLKTFADIFRASIDWSKMSNGKRAKIDLDVGDAAVAALATKMAVESLEEKKATGDKTNMNAKTYVQEKYKG